MSVEIAAAIIGGIIALILVVVSLAFVFKRVPRRLKLEKYQQRWEELQVLCAHKSTWPDAIIKADGLLDDALKRRRFAGKSMGERLVSAQRLFSDNDSLWFGHKLRNKLEQDHDLKLRQEDVKQALLGIKRALKDIGAL